MTQGVKNMSDNITILFNKALYEYTQTWIMIKTFIEMVVDIGIPHAHEITLQTTEKFISMFEVKNAPPEFVANLFAEDKTNKARTATLAAGIIYAHTALDNILTELCTITALEYQERWDNQIAYNELKIKVEEFAKKKYEDIRDEQISKIIERVDRESILTKVDLLFKLCKPRNGDWGDFKYDKDKLKAFDTLRHKIVHYTIPPGLAEIFSEMMEYVHMVGYYFSNMISNSYTAKYDFDIQLKLMNNIPLT
jgi:hypothetical protein